MTTEHRTARSHDLDTGSEASSSAGRPARSAHSPLRFEEPSTPTSPLEARSRKRKAHFEDDPTDEEIEIVRNLHYEQPSVTSPLSRFCLCPTTPRIPRPSNAFILYRQHRAPDIAAKDFRLSNPEQSKILGKEWRNLSDAEKERWHKLAAEVKQRHQQQYPGYRYQPKRSRRSSNLESPLSAGFQDYCERCGGRTMQHPGTPSAAPYPPRPILPPMQLSAPRTQRTLPPVTSLTSGPPNDSRRLSGRPTPPSLPLQQPHNGREHHSQLPPDAKRVRFGASPAHVSHWTQQPGTPYPLGTPYRPEYSPYSYQSPGHGWSSQTPQTASRPTPPAPSRAVLKSSPERTTDKQASTPQLQKESKKSSVAQIHDIPFLSKLKFHRRISPALPLTTRISTSTWQPRGIVIVLEGDSSTSVRHLGQFLEEQLKREASNIVHVERGSSGPPGERTPTIAEFQASVGMWHKRCKGIVEWITSAGIGSLSLPVKVSAPTASGNNEDPIQVTDDKMECDDELVSPKNTSHPNPALSTASIIPPKPTTSTSGPEKEKETNRKILLLNQHTYIPTLQWSLALPPDSYAPAEHWQWTASVFRGTLGADITVFVKEWSAEDLVTASKDGRGVVEVLKEAGLVVVSVKKDAELEGSTMRRVAFEVEEWVRGLRREMEELADKASSSAPAQGKKRGREE